MALRDAKAAQRQRLARLEALQAQRIEHWTEIQRLTDVMIAKKQREIDNLRAALDSMS